MYKFLLRVGGLQLVTDFSIQYCFFLENFGSHGWGGLERRLIGIRKATELIVDSKGNVKAMHI